MNETMMIEGLQARALAIQEKLSFYRANEKKLFATSSFQTQSIPLLHILSTLAFPIPIYFLDTGYLFPETYLFRDLLIQTLNLHVITLKSTFSKLMQIDRSERFLFMTAPDRCCSMNKVLPLEPILQTHDVWISGVRESQSSVRSHFTEEVEGKHNVLRYHPLLKWTAKEIYYYSKYYELPEHPLQEKGYLSIGCIPCTSTMMDDTLLSRKGRWAGMKKQECGLHTELVREVNK